MFTSPLTAEEYRILVDVKYHQGAEAVRGWALRDKYGRTRGWHPHEPGSQRWAHGDDAFRAFVPDTQQRRKLMLLGCAVVATTGLEDLAKLLHTARGDNTATTQLTQP